MEDSPRRSSFYHVVILNLVQDLERNEMPKQVRHDNKKTMNILFIDTSSNEIIKVGLRIGNKKYEIRRRVGVQKAQVVLPLIDKLLKKYNIELKQINAIRVNTGPGSFTGIRVGVAITNALSFALKIPVNGRKSGAIRF